ncbi:2-amino-4-hydroxy-6-hydroxymethyldihydropteridine diphosphokinase [Nannocystaceae bacterium ST9]
MTTRWFVGLGSNLGDRLATLRSAIARLSEVPGFERAKLSSAWSTRPLGPGSGPFLNAAIELRSNDGESPERLLAALLQIEQAHGRIRRERWGDRTLDLDLLCAEVEGRELAWTSERLTLPHPGVLVRDFVLRPLIELDPTLVVAGRRCVDALAEVREPTLIDAPPLAL